MPYPNQVQVSANGQEIGPFTVDVLRSMLRVGTISNEDYVWGEGMTEWITVAAYLQDAPISTAAANWAQAEIQYANQAPSPENSFPRFILDALSYPFRGDGLLILSLGTILFTVLNFLGHFSLYLMIAGWGYLLLMLQEIIHGTASGEKTVPNWPDFDGFGELLGKWFQFFATLAVCLAPGIVMVRFGEQSENIALTLTGLALGFIGLIYCPMALLGVAMFDSLVALNPILVIKSIFTIKGHYFLTLIVLVIVLAVQALTSGLSGILPYAGHLIDELDALWSAVFVARVLGGLYLINRRKLEWF